MYNRMYNSKISSKLLYHFTSDIDVLISILKHGFWPMTAIEDISFMMPNYKEARVGIPMVCFTDIPLKLADEHRKEYGLFGLGMKKEWAINKGLNPVSYMLKGSEIYNAYNHLQWIAQKNALKLDAGNKEGPNTLEMMDAVMNYSGFIKEYSHDITLNSKPFYDEREWRYLPPFKDDGVGIDGYCNRLLPNMVNNKEEKEKLNRHMIQRYTLNFTIDDLETIIVPNQESVSSLCNKLKVDYKLYENKILIYNVSA